MYYSYKFRLYPNKIQKEYFERCFGCTRFLWNQMLADKQDHYKKTGEFLNKEVSEYKKSYKFLKEVDSLALANVKANLEKAYKDFFKKLRRFPKFKSKKKSRNSYTTNNIYNNIRIEGSYIRLPKIKRVKIKIHRPINGIIKGVTVSKSKSLKYYISILVEVNEDFSKLVPNTNSMVALDLGIKDLYTDSNGKKCPNNKFLKKSLERIKFLSKSHSRKKKGSNNKEKARIRLAKAYEKISNQRRDYLHKVSKQILNENQVICLETLSPKSMYKLGGKSDKYINRAVSDAGLGMFIEMLKCKASMYGREIRVVDKYYPSSQRCSSCGAINKGMKNLNQRELCCTSCGTIIDRDYNAALNILQECNKKNRGDHGVSLNIFYEGNFLIGIFDKFSFKDIEKISSLLKLSITQEVNQSQFTKFHGEIN